MSRSRSSSVFSTRPRAAGPGGDPRLGAAARPLLAPGYAINPARDFGPRLFSFLSGYKKIALRGDYGNVNDYFWIPIVGPLVGAVLGTRIYDLFIRGVLVARGVKPDPEMSEQGRGAIEEG